MLHHELQRIARLEREPAREHAVEDDAERVDVRRRRGGLPHRLLGREVRGGPEHRACLRERPFARRQACDAEVGELRAALVVEEHVGGLEVTMDDAARVSVREAGGDAGGDRERLAVGKRPSGLEAVLEGSGQQALQHHVRPAVLFAVVVELRDVRVRQRRERVRLALESRRVGVGGEQLDRDAAPELGVVGGPHLRHPASPQQLVESVAAGDDGLGHASTLCA